MTELEKIIKAIDAEGIRLFRYELTASTNRCARCYVEEEELPKSPALFFANGQSEGRGRLGRSFFSPSSTGVYMTLLLNAPRNSERFALMTSLCAVAVADAIISVLGVGVGIKWVNDLYLNERKVAGILAESFLSPKGERYVSLGIGINLCTADFPADIADKAGALFEYTDNSDKTSEALRLTLAFEICKKMIRALGADDVSAYMERYRQLSCVMGKRVGFTDGGEVSYGVAVGITDMGALVVELEGGGVAELSSGEISLFVKKESEK